MAASHDVGPLPMSPPLLHPSSLWPKSTSCYVGQWWRVVQLIQWWEVKWSTVIYIKEHRIGEGRTMRWMWVHKEKRGGFDNSNLNDPFDRWQTILQEAGFIDQSDVGAAVEYVLSALICSSDAYALGLLVLSFPFSIARKCFCHCIQCSLCNA